MYTSLRHTVGLTCLVFACAHSASSLAAYSVNSIDYPCAVSQSGNYTQLWGNNNNGMVVGYASCDGGTTGFNFLYDPNSGGGTYTRLANPPGFDGITSSVGVDGINDAGEITGGTSEPTVSRGFIYSGGTYTFFSVPGSLYTTGRSISNALAAFPQGLVVGFSSDLTGAADGVIYNPATSAFTALGLPSPSPTIAQGLNVAGQIVGNVKDATYSGAPTGPGAWAFLFTPTTYGDPTQGGTVSYFQINGLDTRARGINDYGVLVANVFSAPTFSEHTYVGTSAGFEEIVVPSGLYAGDCAGAAPFIGAGTEGLNNAGQVNGSFTDTNCVQHGFIASPATTPVGTTASGAYTFSIDVVPNTPIFIDPALALGYVYSIGKHDPAFATVRLPLGIGNNKFVLVVDDKAYDLNAGQLFDFTAHGHKKGVETFLVACIDPAAMLDPVNSLAFPTELTFVSAGKFTGTQQPLALPSWPGIKITQAECRKLLLGRN